MLYFYRMIGGAAVYVLAVNTNTHRTASRGFSVNLAQSTRLLITYWFDFYCDVSLWRINITATQTLVRLRGLGKLSNWGKYTDALKHRNLYPISKNLAF